MHIIVEFCRGVFVIHDNHTMSTTNDIIIIVSLWERDDEWLDDSFPDVKTLATFLSLPTRTSLPRVGKWEV